MKTPRASMSLSVGGGGSSYIHIGDFTFIFVCMIFVDSVLR